MPLKIETDTGERFCPNADKVLPYRELHMEEPKVNGHEGDSLTLTLWQDGSLGVETFTGWVREYEDEEPFYFKPEDAPDAVMAITEWLGSL